MSQKPIRILLVYPPSKTQSHGKCPMGILMLAAVLEKAGNYEIRLLDANAERRKRSTEEIIRYANELKPDLIGITLVTPVVKEAYRLAQGLRGTGAKLIAGGPHATILPEEPLKYGFDTVVIGEGEVTIDEAARATLGLIPKEGVKGLAYMNGNGKAVYNEPRPLMDNLDELPLPARHLVNQEDYAPKNHDLIFSSRGCPGRCSFCSGHLFGKKFRFRSAQNVLDEIFHLYDSYGTTHFHFVDDAMSIKKERFEEICMGLLRSRVHLTWSMMTRVDAVNEDILRLAASAGCTQIDYGVESGFQETLKRIHKPHTAEMVKRIIPLTAKFGIKPNVFFILGFPWEDEEALHMTLKHMKELSPYVEEFHPAIASVLIPFPGTEIYEKYRDEFGFADWWLSEDRNLGTPSLETHPYYEMMLFRNGAVLDADFFKYSREVKRKISSIFKFMYFHKMGDKSRMSNLSRRLMFSLSEKLAGSFPSIERKTFVALAAAKKMMKL